MAVRRVRVILAVIAIWVLGSWYYSWHPPDSGLFNLTHGHAPGGQSVPASAGSKGLKWEKRPPRYPVDKFATLPTNKPTKQVPRVQATKPQETTAEKELRLGRLAAVEESFKHSWNGYKKYAWGHDEIKPLSGLYKNPFGGWAATLVDALDSLWLLGMKEDFEIAVRACDNINFTTTETRDINIFETTIRYLGGFLAAYELSNKQYPSLLKKATEVADLVMTSFDTPNHMPITRFPWQKYARGESQTARSYVLLAEIGSLNLELTKLSQLTGDMQYYDAVQRISDELEKDQKRTSMPGMWSVIIDATKTPIKSTGDSYTLGGMSDSTYEYLGKQYLLLGGALNQPRKMYEGFIEVAKKHLLRRALNPDNLPLQFFADARIVTSPGGDKQVVTTPIAQHLTCFAGGMVGMAAKIFERPSDLDVAEQLTEGCVWSYNQTVSGIGPEIFHFIPCEADIAKDDCQWSEERWLNSLRKYWGHDTTGDDLSDQQLEKIIETRRLPRGMVEVDDRRYILRPEAIESVFMMYRLTGDSKFMDKAWAMFEAIEKWTRSKYASAALDDVTASHPTQVDSMESFWLAETLKYFYLIFGDWDLANLDEWVLNTEAHPLRRADAP
ncbi:glycoside hydrolase family 47 protein [Annulohypoxylon truncatum]|uniref:glycoside hydrolase family 47 protein n=1 Tax=Annulohypoxylon truncatum TaxID=327061 RepID=UPI00200873B8|nr:glycoside hydrolase family 47 protein [Annulohypoxylon truncatum]KAI1205963.1 glycoside hydrolase family 47 protein [Annulohypoxylon truncatum]